MSLCELAPLLAPRLALDTPYPAGFRRRLYTPIRTFWLFLAQIFSPGLSCHGAVVKAHAWLAVGDAVKGDKAEDDEASAGTSGFCTARKRIKEAWLTAISQCLVTELETNTPESWRWFSHPVKVIDGSSFIMDDTSSNQKRWPQPKSEKPGCGFPTARIVGAFSLATGVLLSFVSASLHVNERMLFRRLFDSIFRPGDIALADRGFCGFAVFHELLRRGVHSVMRMHQRLKEGVGLREIRRLGKKDRLMEWTRSSVPSKGYTRAAWKALPEQMLVREITVHVDVPGFRTQTIVVLTTLLDPKAHPARAFADLYRRRWRIEIDLRDLKTTLGMDFIHCKSPSMVRKSLLLFQIAHNLIRSLMMEAAETHGVDVERISFKGALEAAWEWARARNAAEDEDLDFMHRRFLSFLARSLVPLRPDRHEPRAVKYRGKGYALLTAPRHEFQETPHRNRYRAPMQVSACD